MKRQGDLLIMSIPKVPENAVSKQHRVLAEGEVTGHLHELDSGEVYEENGTLFFRVAPETRATLNHPEHAALTFEPGVYKVVRQREYEPKGWRIVAD